MRGLGDLVALILTPFKPLIRRFYGKKGCGCVKRQEALNEKFPFGNKVLTPEEVQKYHAKREEFTKKMEQFLQNSEGNSKNESKT